ncbi:MAG: hypothetical protein PHT38_01190 [Halothiobacillus sp.]|jgi:hypothetical protein|nr:hypothetical protein [Halothiobacillus sp.]
MNILPKFSPEWLAGFVAPQPMPTSKFKQSFASISKTALHFGLTGYDDIASALTSTSFATDLIALNDKHCLSVTEHFLEAELAIPKEHHCTELEIITADDIYTDSDGDPLIEVKITGIPYVIEADKSIGKLEDEQRALILMALDIISESTSGIVQPDFMESGNQDYALSYFWDVGGDELVEKYKALVDSGVSHDAAVSQALSGHEEREDEMGESFSVAYVLDLFEDLRVASETNEIRSRYQKITDPNVLLARASALFRSDVLIEWFTQLAFFLKNHPVYPRSMNELIAPLMEEGECSPEILLNIARSPFAYSLIDELAEGMMQAGEQASLRLWAKDESDLDAVISHIARVRSGIHMTVWLENCVLEELAYAETSNTTSEQHEIKEIAA